MKLFKSILTVSLILLSIFTFAQISLVQTDFPIDGDTLRYSITSPDQVIGFQDTGENHFWDFSELKHTEQDIDEYIHIVEINSYLAYVFGFNAFASSFSDLFDNIEDDFIENIEDLYRVFNKSNTEYTFDGYVMIYSDLAIPMVYSDKDELYQFPFNYEQRDSTTFFGSIEMGDTIYYETKGYRINEGDGWGEITTPYGEFECLRIQTTIYQQDSLYYDSFGAPIVDDKTILEYKWYAKDEKFPILEITVVNDDYSETEIPVMVRYRDIYRPDIEPPIANFEASETAIFVNDTIIFENLSTPEYENNEYKWEFYPANVLFHEDTEASSVGPVISFTEAGSYDVRLTVINDSGTDELIKENYISVENQVFVDNKLQNGLVFYPNPFSDNIYIYSETPVSIITVSDINGKAVYNKKINKLTGFNISLNTFNDGLYILSIYDESNNIIYQQKIIKKKRLLKTASFLKNLHVCVCVYAWAVGPPKFNGIPPCGSISLMGPCIFSYLLIFSLRAFSNLFACCGVNIILDLTFALGTPGIILTKSITNSEFE